VIDAVAFHDWASIRTLTGYMSAGWQEAILRPGSTVGPNQLRSPALYRHPWGKWAPDTVPENGTPGSDPALACEQLLGDGAADRVILGFDDAGLLASGYTNPQAARVAVAAANDWTIDQWLARDHRFAGLALVSTSLPEQAAAEIRRVGGHPQIVGVALGANGLAVPFGHPVYHPIYAAAAELGLPLVIQAGSDTGGSLMTAPIGGGIASTYGEVRAWAAHPLMTHIASMIYEGVFESFPELKVLVVGGGALWVPAYIWRLDFWVGFAPMEAPSLQRRPSEYFRRHVRIATYTLESTDDPARVRDALATVPWLDEVLVYGSGYPNADADRPEALLPRLPESWADRILHTNAEELFGPVAVAQEHAR
jgi:hypothetical protein